MRELRFAPATDLIIDIFNCDDTSDAEVIAAAKAIETQRIKRSDDTAISGGGKVTLSDDSEETFIFGDTANRI